MANQIESKTGKPTPDTSRPIPDVDRHQNDGQAKGSSKGATDQQGEAPNAKRETANGPDRKSAT